MPASRISADPRNLQFTQWADIVCSDNASIPRPMNQFDWREWAKRVLEVDGNAPSPDQFGDWREWGMAWINAV